MSVQFRDTENLDRVWSDCLHLIEAKIPRQSFNTWFKPTSLLRLDDNQVVIQVPSQFFSDWLEKHYIDTIRSAVLERAGGTRAISFGVPSEGLRAEPPLFMPPSQGDAIAGATAVFHLNKRYTFDSFVVGESNCFPYSAAEAVAKSPGKTLYNPLVIYGGVGLGKTHLLQAIGHYCVANQTARTVVYISSEKFVSDFIQSIKNRDTTEFVRTYRTADVLLVDDIQFFPQNESTQKEFFHTFNTLHQNGKQIVLSSDCPPDRLKGLEERLISRFQWGLVAGIDKPDIETRMAILKKKAESEGFFLEDGIARLIASQADSNIRELEGVLAHLLAQVSLRKATVTHELISGILSQTAKPVGKTLTIDRIQRVTAQHFAINENLLVAKTRKQDVSAARQVAMYLCRKMTSSSLQTIGLYFGGRDHSTVVHACQSVEARLEGEPGFAEHLKRISEDVQNTVAS